MYDGDSFFTLSIAGQIGLAVLSIMLAAICLFVQIRFGRGFWGIALAAVLFYGFVALSPQIYYAYYRAIIEGLPAQWVTRVPSSTRILELATFQEKNLSAHSQGALGWALCLISLVRFRR